MIAADTTNDVLIIVGSPSASKHAVERMLRLSGGFFNGTLTAAGATKNWLKLMDGLPLGMSSSR
jgi:hypothetical protein